jgi:23S rRNA (pseudouridine1915-N3)-methyltransferase
MYLTFHYNNTIISDFIRRYNNLVCISEIRYTASMKITILCVGKIKEKYFRDAIAEYEKRLGRYCKLEIVEVADEKTPDGASGAEEQQIRRKEGERLLKYLEGKNCYVIALAINGKMLDSVALSEKVSDLMVKGNSHIVLVIGGSLGIADEVLKRADEKISFSKMTFPHQLMRVILLEQLYRSYRIINHEPYHK